MAVLVDLNISLDGYASTTDQSAENPMGLDWFRLVEAYSATRTFRARVLHETDGSGTTGIDDDYVRQSLQSVGAHIMEAGMFGLHAFPDNTDWSGWWGDEPPFESPVFVLTHAPRPSISMKNGTVYHFLDTSLTDALAQASAAAGGGDVRISGGVSLVRDYLRAGLVDQLHVGVAPLLLGRGDRLWDDLRGLENDYDVTTEAAPSGTVHVTFRR